MKVEGCGQGDKPYDRIVQTPAWYLHLLAAPDEVAGMTFGYTGRKGIEGVRAHGYSFIDAAARLMIFCLVCGGRD